MTAEVAIANKMAVALAADSAATSSSNKIYSSQKLFPLLEQHHAVGVMIFQNSEFMGIPWETIISMYRQSHADTPQPTIQCYVHDFLEYIGKAPLDSRGSNVCIAVPWAGRGGHDFVLS